MSGITNSLFSFEKANQVACRLVAILFSLAITISIGCSPSSNSPSGQDSSPDQTDRSEQVDSDTDAVINLMSEKHLKSWVPAKFGGQGETEITSEKFELGFGYNMTGVVFQGQVPKDNYRVTYEAKKVDGSDFFGTITFPVQESHCSFVLGGWGGATVGLSSIDNEDASQNATKKIVGLGQDKWHEVKVEVTWPKVKCWINDELMVDVDLSGKQVSVRGDVEVCRPLGFCSFETRAEIRNVCLTPLQPKSN